MPIASRKQAWMGRKRPVPALAQGFSLPSPVGGLNAQAGLTGMAPDEAVTLVNLVPGQYGTKLRTGYAEWQRIPLFGEGEAVGEVRTIIPYTGSKDDRSKDKLFAATQYAMYDVSSLGVIAGGVLTNPPTKIFDFPSSTTKTGHGTFVHMTNDGGAHFLIYADAEHGLYQYSEATNTWAKYHLDAAADPLHIQNVDPANLTFVMLWKNRVWFAEKDSSRAWYLGLGLLSGAATKFDFGPKFMYGGSLAGLFNWTYNGGAGPDDLLVAVGRAGDVAVYEGTNPADAATFGVKGVWYVGEVAEGKRCATNFGGDLLLLCAGGVLPLSTLVQGAIPMLPQTYVTDKITPLVAAAFASTTGRLGWEFRLNPVDDVLFVTVPILAGADPIQYVMDMNRKKWAVQSGVPANCTDIWHNRFYFGTKDGRVCTHSGTTDNALLDGTSGNPIDGYCITSFQAGAAPGAYKQVQFIRPVFVGPVVPTHRVSIRYDYNTSELPGVVGAGVEPVSGWDASVWDTSAFGGSNSVYEKTAGTAGMGRVFAIALRLKSAYGTTLVSFDGMIDYGGYL